MPSPLDQPEQPTPASHTPDGNTNSTTTKETLLIEAAQSEPAAPVKEEAVQTLDLGEGNVIKMDKLGPMIINNDGTMSRISNWHELHPIEQERTVRLLVKKRNLVRLEKLDKESTESDGGEKLSALAQSQAS